MADDQETDDTATRELDATRKHAEPSRGDKTTKDGQRVSTADDKTVDNPEN